MTSFSLSPLLAFGDWTLDIDLCAATMSMVLFNILAFLVIAFPLLLLLGVFLREQFWPKKADAPNSADRVDETLGL